MSQRFYAPEARADAQVELTDAEAHHLLHVMRARVGDVITLFDGAGQEFPATISRLARAAVTVETGTANAVDRELPFRLIVGVALPKGDRQRWLVEKLVELGATVCQPLRTERGVVQPEGGTPEKLRRAVVEASKQCGRNRLMEIAPLTDWSTFLATAATASHRWIAHPPDTASNEGAPHSPPWSTIGSGDEVFLAIGPEGGFTESEVEAAVAAGWQKLGLGPRYLRIETAAIAAVATLAAQFEWRAGPSSP